MTNPSGRRLFFALWPDDDFRDELVRVTRPMTDIATGRLVPPENYHLTLLFLDHVPDADYDAVVAAGRAVQFDGVSVELNQWGVFEGPKVIWYGNATQSDALVSIVEHLRNALDGVVKLRRERSFRPHVSLVRKQTELSELAPPEKLVWQASDFVLVESVFGPGRAIYRVLERFSG